MVAGMAAGMVVGTRAAAVGTVEGVAAVAGAAVAVAAAGTAAGAVAVAAAAGTVAVAVAAGTVAVVVEAAASSPGCRSTRPPAGAERRPRSTKRREKRKQAHLNVEIRVKQ